MNRRTIAAMLAVVAASCSSEPSDMDQIRSEWDSTSAVDRQAVCDGVASLGAGAMFDLATEAGALYDPPRDEWVEWIETACAENDE